MMSTRRRPMRLEMPKKIRKARSGTSMSQLSMVRNEESHHTLSDIYGCVEQPGGLAVSGSMETYAEHYNSLNDLNKTNGNEHAMSMQKRKAVRPAHLTRAKAVRPVHSQRTCYASQHEDQAPLRLVSAMSRIVSMSAKLAARKRAINVASLA